MERIKEKEIIRYVVATLDKDGKIKYLRSLHGGNYQLVDNIEYATKLNGEDTANTFYKFACQDFGSGVDLVLLQVVITYELVKDIWD